MKQNIILMTILTSIICLTACKKSSLTLTDPNNAVQNTYYKSEKEALSGLAGIFDAFQSNNLTGKRYREFDHLTDNATTVQNTGGYLEIENSTHGPQSQLINTVFWPAYYTVISRANLLISDVTKMDSTTINSASRKRIIAEASFLRDYAYCDLTALWADVPLSLSPLGPFAEPLSRTSKTEIYTKMIDDLLKVIIPNLPLQLTAAEAGRIGKGAAKTLLAKYYLYQKDYANAAIILKEVIESRVYSLYPDYAKLFTESGEFSSESVFEINFNSISVDVGENFSVRIDTAIALVVPSQFWAPIRSLVNSYLCTDGRPVAASTLYGTTSPLYVAANPYNNRDPRLRATVFTNADNTPGGKKIWRWTDVNSFAVKKYTSISNVQFISGGVQNYYVIRYADVLLLYAEAENEASGATANVYSAVNLIRQRVGMPNYPAGLTKDQMRSYIRDERRWEFALEHQRYFDLQRWGITGQVVTAASPLAGRKVFTEPRDYLWPYPQNEMDRNPAMNAAGQNPGW